MKSTKLMNQLIFAALLIVCAIPATAQASKFNVHSDKCSHLSSLPGAAQGIVSATLGADIPDYVIQPSGNYAVAQNPRQKLEARFSPVGVEVHRGDARLGMALQAYGYGYDLMPLPAIAPRVTRNRVEYRRGSLAEWYVNGPVGLEQGFTIDRAPGKTKVQLLTIALTLSGDLHAVVDEGKTSLTLTDHVGRSQLRYTGLSAYDADGKVLPAWIELRGKRLLLRVDDVGARYPLVVDPWVQLAELTSSDGVAGDEFGFAVAVKGNTVVVGASQFNSSKVGAAYVFVKGVNGWTNMTQTAKLTASDATVGANFGSSVAFVGSSTVVVGAPHAAVGANQNQGEAYVFVEPLGGWVNMTETARLTSADGAANDFFGYSVSGSGNTIAVGAPQASAGVQAQGVVYLFVKPTAGWKTASKFKAKLTASNAQFDNGLGVSVSLNSVALVAGAAQANSGKGAAYVFVKPLTGWNTTSTFNAELTASDGQSDDLLGNSVSISGSTIVAGAYLAKIGVNLFQGAAYVFVEPPSGWANMTETAKLTASDGQSGDEFSYSVSISGNVVVAGASNDPSTNAAYVFVKPTSGWVTTSKFKAKLTASDATIFGFAVAVNGTTIVSGAIGNHGLQGAAYVF